MNDKSTLRDARCFFEKVQRHLDKKYRNDILNIT